ncbi:MAG TPA: hypothetical protein VKE74_20970 [Gemmataceae bacterium]|nr:hypothetical protein [Gemmataceae bacterium]
MRVATHPPTLDVLEDRTVPSTFTVLNPADSGSGSLRAAVLAAEAHPGPDVIDFARGVQGTITLTGGELLVTSDLAIDGPGANRLTVSGGGASRVFHVVGGADAAGAITVTISGLTVANGRADRGGGVRNEGFSDLTLDRVTVSDSVAVGTSTAGARGGGVFSIGVGAGLTVRDCMIAGNVADGRLNARSGMGGGIHVEGGALAVLGSTVADNQALGGTGGIGQGGGVRTISATATIRETVVARNEAVGGAGEFLGGFGGGVAAFGALTMTDCTVAQNRAVGGFNPDGYGFYGFAGGIDVFSTATITRCTIDGNEAVAGAGSLGGLTGDGGGIRVSFGASAVVADSRISNNKALGGRGGNGQGGGILLAFGGTLDAVRCELIGNLARGGDGGIGQGTGGGLVLFLESSATLTDCTIAGNRAVGGDGGHVSGSDQSVGPAFGGGVANTLDSRLEITRCTIRGNEAVGGSNVIHDAPNLPDAGSGHGGGILALEGAQTVVRDSFIDHNRAVGGNNNRGSGVAGFVGSGVGGGIENSIDGAVDGFGPTRMTIVNCTIAYNEAAGGIGNTGGGTLYVGAGLGGGIANYLGATTEVTASRIEHNAAVGGRDNTIAGGPLAANLGAGGGVFNALGDFVLADAALPESVVRLTDDTVADNQARGGPTGRGLGGGAYNDGSSSLTLRSTTVTRNHATGVGAGQGVVVGVYNLGSFDFDALTLIVANHASTTNYDVFDPFA